ncbi:hypothetical protein MRX96_008238 [Rhipicephalus microplus]
MAKNRMVTKHCPKCEQQVPVACKSCPCGHEFFASRKSRGASEQSSQRPRRRTERVRKERQSYLTALVLEQRAAAARAKRARRNGSRRGRPPANRSSSHDSGDEGRKLNRPRCGPAKPAKPVEPEMPDEEEEDVFAGCSQERLELYAAILADINRKLSSQLFHRAALMMALNCAGRFSPYCLFMPFFSYLTPPCRFRTKTELGRQTHGPCSPCSSCDPPVCYVNSVTLTKIS